MVASNKYSQNSQFFDHILEHCVSSPWVLWPNKHVSPVQLSFYFQVFSIGVKFHPWHKQTVDYWGCFLHQKFHPSKKFCHPYSEPPNSDPRLWGDICAWKFSNVMILKMILKSTENYTFFLLILKKWLGNIWAWPVLCQDFLCFAQNHDNHLWQLMHCLLSPSFHEIHQ